MKMSISRVALVLVQAFANQLACTPPNPTPSKGRYHTDEIYILQIAPFIFKVRLIIPPSLYQKLITISLVPSDHFLALCHVRSPLLSRPFHSSSTTTQ